MRQRHLMNQINVVPYIDVMLVLLIIFMVTASAQTGSIDIPSSGSLPSPPSEAMVIEINAQGKLSIRKTAGSPAVPVPSDVDFQKQISAALAANEHQTFLVAANHSVPYQKVIDVLESARQLNVKKISLQTQPSR